VVFFLTREEAHNQHEEENVRARKKKLYRGKGVLSLYNLLLKRKGSIKRRFRERGKQARTESKKKTAQSTVQFLEIRKSPKETDGSKTSMRGNEQKKGESPNLTKGKRKGNSSGVRSTLGGE